MSVITHVCAGFVSASVLSANVQACTVITRIPTGSVTITTDIRYGVGPGQTGILNMPIGVINPPVILFVHGGGFVSGNAAGLQYAATTLAYNTQAAVFNIDYNETSPDPGGAIASLYDQEVRDVRCAAKWITRPDTVPNYGFDGTHAGIIGFSAGGSLAITAASSTYADGIDDPTCPQLDHPVNFRAAAVLYPMAQGPGPSTYTWSKASAPIVYSAVHPQMMSSQHWVLANGSADGVVPVDQTPIMTQALQAVGASVDYSATIQGLPHGFGLYSLQQWAAELPATCAVQALFTTWL